jgi:serine/threonine protein phosphatase 1
MRTLVVGDIHGCYNELRQLLRKVQLAPEDCLVALGDIVDRGPDSVKVYNFLRNRPNTIVLMGNHERKHLRQALSYSQEIVKLQFGDRYPEFLNWCRQLPYYYETEDAIFVHAAVEDGIAMAAQQEEILCGSLENYWTRKQGRAYWTQFYSGTKPVIFGHHSVEDQPLIVNQKVYGIDTGACYGGKLTGVLLPSFEIVQVPAQHNYWQEEIAKWQLPVMQAKPWHTYKWEQIKAMCEDYRDDRYPELVTFMVQKKYWMNDLLGMAAIAIPKIEAQLTALIAEYGRDGFKQQASQFSYAALLLQANGSQLTPELLQKTLPTPKQWIQVMTDLEIYS